MIWKILEGLLIATSKTFEVMIKIFALLIDGIEILINVVHNKCQRKEIIQ